MTGRILIADDVSSNRIVMKSWLMEAAYDVVTAASPREMLDAARTSEPDLVLVPDTIGDTTGDAIIKELREIPPVANSAMVYLSDDRTVKSRCAAVKAGYDAILPRNPDPTLLRARIRNLMRRSAAEAELRTAAKPGELLGFSESAIPSFAPPGQIALIAGSLAEGLDWRNGLTSQMRDRIAVLDPARALKDLNSQVAPDTVVIAAPPDHPELALQVISDLRARAETMRSSVILVQPTPDIEHAVRALDLGANDVVDIGFDPHEMAHILRRELSRKAVDDTHRATLQDGVRLASTDPLTGLLNRRSALTQLNRVMLRAKEQNDQFAVMVLDLDRFKSINDTYGHNAGDTVLMEISNRMQACLRRGDFMARIGGEEFLAVIRTCDLEAARIAAERLRLEVGARPVRLPDGMTEIDVTVSIGLVIGGKDGATGTASELIDLADRGLYVAKADGRNQVTVYQTAA